MRAVRKHNPDGIMQETMRNLVDDFSPTLPEDLQLRIRAALLKGVKDVRSFEWPNAMMRDSYAFKCQYQLQSFWKRYIFADDVYDDKTLKEEALVKFRDSQSSYGIKDGEHPIVKRVINAARREAERILGSFSYDEWFHRAKFGGKAARGVSRDKSYLDVRCEKPTATRLQVSAMKMALLDDVLLSSIVSEQLVKLNAGETYATSTPLTVTAVPKSWKSNRTIAPDTVIGGYLSLGLGAYIRHQLEANTHINLKHAQMLHRRLACKGSIDGRIATADLSAASDSFTWEIAKLLLPSDWRAPLRICRSPRATISKADTIGFNINSLMLMGSGHTFPLQTMLFYCLLKAIADDLGVTGRCYVYGDDLIYPVRMHRAVAWTFTKLGFTLNGEKSFADGPFRESCGGDFHRGVDVRPCMPKGSSSHELDDPAYCAFLYTVINGLLHRWHWLEIPVTIARLLKEVCKFSSGVFIVREDDPDTSGLKHLDVDLAGLPVHWPEVHCVNGLTRYRYNRIEPKRLLREVKNVSPYLWDSLRASAQGDDRNHITVWDPKTGILIGGKYVMNNRELRYESPTEVLLRIKGRDYVAEKGEPRYSYTVHSDMDSVWPGLTYYKRRWLTS